MLRHVVSRVARQVRAHDWNPAPARTRAPSPGWGLFWKISRVCERSHLTLPPNLHVPIAPQARAPVYQSVSVRAMADSAVSADDTSAAWAKVKASIASEDGLRNTHSSLPVGAFRRVDCQLPTEPLSVHRYAGRQSVPEPYGNQELQR